MAPIEGLHVPLVTPFDRAGAVDLRALERLAHRLLDDGADGLVALGTTAEAATLDDAERDAVVDRCAGVCAERGVPLTVGAGGNDTAAAAAEVARRGARPGVTALLSVVPPYTRPSPAGMRAHFAALADASPVPLLLYDVPARTGVRLPAADQLALAAAAPMIAGVKLAVPALDDDALELLEQAPPRFAVLCGEDRLLLPIVAAGGRGAISAAAHVATGRFAALIAAGRAGDLTAAREESRALAPLVRALFAEPNPAVIKALLAADGAIESADVRLPLTRASAVAVERARAAAAALAATPAAMPA